MALQKLSSKPKTLRGFELSMVIGKGSYGEVWLARHIKDKRPYVLKKINLKSTSDKERRAAEQEARLLSNLKHPNIVTYKDSFQTGERYLYIAMQYCEGGDLYTLLKERKGKVLEEKQVVEWFIQIAMALQYLHERDILHRDLKTQNIFLTKNKIIKVGDLGIARVLENSSDMATTLIGTPYYMSPELFSSKPYNQKSDVWALGCCVYEMTTLRHAFNARDMNSLAFKILSGKLPPMPQLYSSELVQLIQNMLHQDPSRRPSVSRLLRMSYVKKNIAQFLEETRKSRRPLPPTPDKTAKAESSLPSSSSYSAHPHSHKQYCNPSVAKKDQLDGRAKVVHPDVECISIDSQNTMVNDTLPVQVIHNKEIAAKIGKEAENECSSSSHTNSISEEHSLSPNSSIISLSSSTQSSLNECASVMEESDSGTQDTVIKNTVIQHSAEKSRPLPPPPVIDIGNSEPQNTNSCVPRLSSSSSSSKECSSNLGEGEAPKSLPNVLARQKRRQKQSLSCSLERHECRVELKQPSKLAESYDIRSEPRSVVPLKNVLPQQQYRQPEDDEDEENSSPEDNTRATKNKWDKLREDRDMENLAVVLNTTLQTYWKSNDEKSDDDCTTVIKSTNKVMDTNSDDGEINDLPSAETLVQTKRLSDRINILEKNCESGVGKQILQQAIDILDKFEEEDIKPRLEELLGEEKFDQYAGKIWQLKYCRQMAVSY
ncbi:serine/threonine-protein kinase Nek4 isoform X2 [Octopus sinensis]|uniref:non-specific serine/threonine protein kinase n=1 Tax=Octopus sinensis TaxID=2607531 RepID=A0A7E6ERT4_9MOLL|nr:serine/threonine-protein kinase Nek4 isoform X2 [Octopus sinensis]